MDNVDIIIPNYNGLPLLMKYLPSVVKCFNGLNINIVDDGSNDDSIHFIETTFPSINIIKNPSNTGFSSAVNLGIKSTNKEYILLLNNDIEINENFLEILMPVFEDKEVFSVSPRIIIPSIGYDQGYTSGFLHHGIFYTSGNSSTSEITPILYTTGCASIYRRSMLEALNGFDEIYNPYYWEDTDLGYRAWKRGWKSLYHPGGFVYHQHSASIGNTDKKHVDSIKARNALYFIWRNIEDKEICLSHRIYLPLILAKRLILRDFSFINGWRLALKYKDECKIVKENDSRNRVLSDKDIFRNTIK